MKNKILAMAVAMVGQFGFSQEINTEKLDAYFKALEDNQKFMGSVVIAKEGKPIYTKSVGFANIEKGTKNTENTRFRIGSITKTFTSILVLKAVEEGRLSLNDKLSKFYPNIKNSEKITIENMLQNRSGLIRDIYDNDKDFDVMKNSITEKQFVEKLVSHKVNFEPDTEYEYSNSNFVLLGYIVEKVFKKSYEDLIQKYIAKPLDLKNTYYSLERKEDEASYHIDNSKWDKWDKIYHLSHVGGAGAMISSTNDLVKFINDFPKLLTKEHFEKMKTFRDGYGYGLMEVPFYNHKGYGHGGTIENFLSVAGYFPNEKISYSRIINGININQNDLDIGILNIVFNRPYEIPSFKTIEVSEADLEPFVGDYKALDTEEIQMKVKVFKKGNQLFAQAERQQAMPLEATAKNVFKFDPAGITIEFRSNGKMTLKQAGFNISFVKENEETKEEKKVSFTPTESDLKTYVGTYSSKKLPLKIKFFIENGKLMSQADGQEAFELEGVKQHHFRFEPAGIKLEFIPTEKKMKFQQGGMAFEFEKNRD